MTLNSWYIFLSVLNAGIRVYFDSSIDFMFYILAVPNN